tara:strand:+ start:1137 stop:2078 length:942 start_codon:yes stop_codon:yes gene_type:complete
METTILRYNEEIYYKCPICSSQFRKWRDKKVDDKIYNLDLCNSCGYSFVNPRPSLAFLIDYYSAFGHGHLTGGVRSKKDIPTLSSVLKKEKEYPNSTIDAKRLVKTIKSLSKNINSKKLLDVGCGYGFLSKEALDVGYDVTALELASSERKIAMEMTGLNPASCSFEEFECPAGSVDVVLMSQILEHALDVNLWINKARGILADDGIIAIALPNYGSIFRMIMKENEPFICPPDHLNFFNPKSLTKLLDCHGFKVEKIQWSSRIPKSAFKKRVPKLVAPLLPIINIALSIVLKVIDTFHLGSIINVYARKISD